MIRLLAIVNVFHPDRGGGAAVFSDLFYSLAQRGFDVTVRCAYPYYPEWQDKSGRNGWNIWRYQERGVTVERYGLFIPRNPNSIRQRLLYEGSFFISLLRSLLRGRSFDIVMVYCPLIGAVAFASLYKRLYKHLLWLNVQDLPADAASSTGISRSGFMNRFMTWVQNTLFKQADVWSSISPIMIDRLHTILQNDRDVLYLPNWLNLSLDAEIQSLPSKAGRTPSRPIRLLYAGNIGTKQDLLRFCKVLQQSHVPFEFSIHGNGGGAASIRAWIMRTNDPRFQFGPFLEESGFARVLHKSDFFVITEKHNIGGSFIPSKLIPGIASGTPILAVCDNKSPLGQEMHTAQLGPWYPWTDLDAIPLLIEQIPDNPHRYLKWQSNALHRARFYDREHIIDCFEGALRALVQNENPAELDML